MQRLFLDTNAVLDFLGERKPFYESVAKLLTLADKKQIAVFTSPTSIATTYYVLARFESKKTVLEKIRKFKMLCSISVMDDDVVEKSINSGFSAFEDGLQYYSALATDCGIIITRNEKDFKNALIPVMNAENYLQTKRKINK